MSSPSAALLLNPKAYKKQVAGRSNPSPNNRPTDSPQSAQAGAPPGTSFNSRQLLNPRRFNAMNRSPINANSPRRSDPQSHGDDASTINSSSRQPPSKRNFDEFLGANKSDMIEDMYGVQRREDQPTTRAVENQQSKATNGKKATKFPSGSTVLGDYMNEKLHESAQPTQVKDTIDLTLDNDDQNNEDDDVIFLSNKDLGSEEVCYGKLEGAHVLAYVVPTPPSSVFGRTGPDWPSIRCELVRNRGNNTKIEVIDSSNRVFGAIEARVADALAPLLDTAYDLRTRARLDVRRKKVDEWPGKPCSDSFRISINLYGPRKFADVVGNVLGRHNLWLGIPNTVDAGVATFNPHAERRRLIDNARQSNRLAVQSETRTVEEISSAVTKMFDQLRSAKDMPEMEPPDLVKTDLLPHQRQALWFMTEKEKSRKIGADDEDDPKIKSLWRIQRQANGRPIYHEIITGATVTEEPPQSLGGLLADMMGLGKTLSILSLICASQPESIEWANKSKFNAKTTLLVSPLSAVGNWVSQIKEHLKENALSYYVFHGTSRTEDPEELLKYDIVITTYTTVLSDISGKSSKRGTSPLVRLKLFRIVLDEAHIIREQSAAQSQAIFGLEAQRRWSVTGTPIQNRLEDLGSVTKFLRLYPYNERGRFTAHIVSPFKFESPTAITNLRVLVDSFTLRRVKDRITLPPRHDQTMLLSFSEQEKSLHDFFKKESNFMMNVVTSQTRQKTNGRIYHIVLKAMMILRQISAHGKELLDKEDRERFRGLTASDAIDLEEVEDSATASDKKAYEIFALMKESSADACAQCGSFSSLQAPDYPPADNVTIAAILPCYDILCVDCFGSIKSKLDKLAGKSVQCMFCKGAIAATYSMITIGGFEQYQAAQAESKRNGKQVKALGQYEGPHTKTKALISQLLNTAEENKRLAHSPPIKSIIFSSWTSHLDLIEIALEDNGLHGFTRLDGTMSLKQRNAALETFQNDDKITLFLVTLGAGGVGLNLTAASKVYIMEPQYNPAAVAQAIDRVHRIGQTREVSTVQFIMKESIEEKITELAKRKQKLAELSLNQKMSKSEMQLERLKEYKSLFK
ncbi:hypothetical protein FQN57_002828 [Myotisia sp. PD_48]|nr:hypothetical protein FQN57_002828 [Myotisia sp. PD_48]